MPCVSRGLVWSSPDPSTLRIASRRGYRTLDSQKGHELRTSEELGGRRQIQSLLGVAATVPLISFLHRLGPNTSLWKEDKARDGCREDIA